MPKDPRLALQNLVGRNVQRVRHQRGFTQERAAELTGIDTRRWQEIEAGRVNITLLTLGRIARTLKITPAQLLSR